MFVYFNVLSSINISRVLKLAGATYMEVHKAGGGIHYTVHHTRQASEEELFLTFETRLMAMRNIGIKNCYLNP